MLRHAHKHSIGFWQLKRLVHRMLTHRQNRLRLMQQIFSLLCNSWLYLRHSKTLHHTHCWIQLNRIKCPSVPGQGLNTACTAESKPKLSSLPPNHKLEQGHQDTRDTRCCSALITVTTWLACCSLWRDTSIL